MLNLPKGKRGASTVQTCPLLAHSRGQKCPWISAPRCFQFCHLQVHRQFLLQLRRKRVFGEKEEKSCEVNKINHPFIFVFLGLHLQHMEVPRLEFKLELQPQIYTIATAMRDLSSVCDLHHRSRQCRILNHRVGPGIEPKPHGY